MSGPGSSTPQGSPPARGRWVSAWARALHDPRVAAGLLAVAAVALLVMDGLALVWDRPPQVDDAYISYRYAINLVEGAGLVWNEGERVEGITNPLWTGIIALGLWLGADAPELAWALGLGSGLALLGLTFLLARAWLPAEHRFLAPLAAAPAACSASLWYWSTAGLETSFHAAWVCLALLLATRSAWGPMVVALVVTTYSRMDGVLLAAVLLGFQLLPRWRAPRAWVPGLVYGTVVALGLLARLAYYGSLVPNTYWAKVGGTPLGFGLVYVGRFLAVGALPLLVPAVLAALRVRVTRPAFVYVLVSFAYVAWVGGDAFRFSRFLLAVLGPLSALALVGLAAAHRIRPGLAWLLAPSLPLACALFVGQEVLAGVALALGPAWLLWGIVLWRPLPARTGTWAAAGALAVGALAVTGVAGGPRGVREHVDGARRGAALHEQWRYDGYMEDVSRRRAEAMLRGEPPELIAAGAIGAIGYYTRLPVLDILGLTDPHIARSEVADRERGLPMPGHARSDADYVLSKRPEYIVIPRPSARPAWIYALQDLWAHPEFERLYVWDETVMAYRLRGEPPSTE